MAISVRDDGQWQGLVRAMGAPAWALAPELDHREGRLARAEELDHRLAEWTRPQAARAVMELLQGLGVPAGAANDGRDLGQDPQLIHDGYYARREHPTMGLVDYAGHSLVFPLRPSGWSAPLPGRAHQGAMPGPVGHG